MPTAQAVHLCRPAVCTSLGAQLCRGRSCENFRREPSGGQKLHGPRLPAGAGDPRVGPVQGWVERKTGVPCITVARESAQEMPGNRFAF